MGEEIEPQDEEWLAELDKRYEELESGKVKGLTWDEVKERVLRSLNKKSPIPKHRTFLFNIFIFLAILFKSAN